MRARAAAIALALCLGAGWTGTALGQVSRFPPPTPPPFPYGPSSPAPRGAAGTSDTDATLRGRFGVELAARLLRSDDPDTRLHGAERAAAEPSTESMVLLVRTLDAGGAARQDGRVLVAVARGLRSYSGQAEARAALQNIVSSPTTSRLRSSSRAEASPDGELERGRIELARGIAALALAESPDIHARDSLWSIARGGGSGQPYAAEAILAYPFPQSASFGMPGLPSPPLLRLVAAMGDLRALDMIRSAAKAADSTTRAAALAAIGEMGDLRGIGLARAAVSDLEPGVREAAAKALVLLGAPEGPRAVEALIAAEGTALAGIRLAELVQDDGVIKALAARLVATADRETRRAAIEALGRSTRPTAIEVLAGMTRDPVLAGDAAAAIARSPCAGADRAITALLSAPEGSATRRLGARASLLREVVRGTAVSGAHETFASMARSRDPSDRAVGAAARVLLGSAGVEHALSDADARVKWAVAAASVPRRTTRDERSVALLVRLAQESDPITRIALSVGLLNGDPEGVLTTSALLDRAESGEPDAPLAAMSFAMRAGQEHEGAVQALLASRDPLIRAHVARGLAESAAKNAIGRIASAYAYEPEAGVRMALVLAAATRTQDAASPDRRAMLSLASRLDPDRAVRQAAARAELGLPAALGGDVAELAWVRLTTDDGRPPAEPMAAALVRSDGIAIPVVFDTDGYALVPVPPGETRLVLAPRLPAYEPSLR